jgi:excisionase family DNA binding protein
LTPDEFAKLLKVSRAKFFKMKAAGRLPAPVYLGRLPRWKLRLVRDWMDADCPDRETWEQMLSDWEPIHVSGGSK